MFDPTVLRSYESEGKLFQTGPEMEGKASHSRGHDRHQRQTGSVLDTLQLFNKTQSRCFPDRGINNHLHTLKSKKDLGGGSSIPSLINNLSIKVLRIEVMLSSRVTREWVQQ